MNINYEALPYLIVLFLLITTPFLFTKPYKVIGKECVACKALLKEEEVLKLDVEYAVLDKCPKCNSINTIVSTFENRR